jgi:hypothetical protein
VSRFRPERGEEVPVAELVVVDAEVLPDPQAVVPVAVDGFVESIVARICADYGAPPDEVRAHAARLLRGYDTARVRSFVPILVEKKLREAYRRREPTG